MSERARVPLTLVPYCTMPSKQPQLGSLAIQAPSLTPKTVHVSPSTCHDVSVFKGASYQRRSDHPRPDLLTHAMGIPHCLRPSDRAYEPVQKAR